MRPVLALLFFLSISLPALAAGQSPPLVTSLSYTPVTQFKTDLDGGGSFRVDRHFLHLDFFKPLSRTNQVGFGLHYDYEYWSYTGVSTINGATPWSHIHRPTLGFSWIHSLNKDWQLFLAPSVGLSGTTLSNSVDSLVYGSVLSVSRNFTQDFRLGLGTGVFERLGKTSYFPFVMVSWQISDNIRLKNPFRAGPVGPAGLELEYRLDDSWTFAVGGAYRSYRFRLSDTNSVPDGVGEVDFIAGFVQAHYDFNERIGLGLIGGGLFAGDITIENENGSRLGNVAYDTAPFLALTFKGRF